MKKMKKVLCFMALLAVMSFTFAGCGGVNSATDSNNSDQNTGNNDNAENDGNGVAQDIGDAAGDLAEGAGNAVGDLLDGSNGFDNYDDAHDFFLQEMGRNNADAKYEVRNEKKDELAYDNDNGRKGYQFELYDTSDNQDGKRVGLYYVDSKDGKIYKKNEKTNELKEVVIQSNDNGTTNSNGTNGSDTNGTGTDNGTGTGNGTDTNGGTGNGTNTNGMNGTGTTNGKQ